MKNWQKILQVILTGLMLIVTLFGGFAYVLISAMMGIPSLVYTSVIIGILLFEAGILLRKKEKQ